VLPNLPMTALLAVRLANAVASMFGRSIIRSQDDRPNQRHQSTSDVIATGEPLQFVGGYPGPRPVVVHNASGEPENFQAQKRQCKFFKLRFGYQRGSAISGG